MPIIYEDIRNRALLFVGLLIMAIAFLIPTIFPGAFSSWISKPISLGLDLKGGVHLVYDVKVGEAVKSRLLAKANAIKAELKKDKVPILRVRLNNNGEIEFTLLNDRMLDRLKDKTAQDFPELTFVSSRPEAGGRLVVVYSLAQHFHAQIEEEAVLQSIETLRNRVDQFGVAEPLIQRAGSRRIILQMPGVKDVESVKKVVGKTAKLEFRFLPSTPSGESLTLKDRSGIPVNLEEEVLMTGDAVEDARVTVDDHGQVAVSLTLNSEGGLTFAKVTTEGVGRNMAIILDNIVYSSPVIREPITQGRANISGHFTMEEAKQLAVVLRAGALPAPLDVMEERTVGPTLGAQSIRNGIIAIVVGFLAIIIFMMTYYRKAGLVAVCSLLLNLVFMLALLSAFGATMTLPGLAGLALTLGMAVDSNVLIFERIRDELRNGSSRDAAVSAGFSRALTAIMDSNATHLLASLILYYFGTGPIRGFAVTLCVGIVTTLYCATTVSRLAFDVFELKGDRSGVSI